MTADERGRRLAEALDDLLARRRRGEAVGSEAYVARLGADAEALEGALRAAEVLDVVLEGIPDAAGGAAPTRYRLGRELGRGGAGIVFEAFDAELARTVAWKTLRSDARLDAAASERFRREARACARLRHPHVVAIHDAGETDGRPWYAMELVPGGTLAARLRARTQPPLPELLRGLAGIADGLAALHVAGLVHRDVKPSNVLVREDGSFALADFGLARALDGSGPTLSGQVLGSPPYMSPEQALGRLDAVDARTDVYALGATVFHAVTGAPPFSGDDPGEVLRRVRVERPPRASSRVAGLPRDLDAVLARALAKRPEDRTPSAAALRDDLLALAQGRVPPSLRARRTRRALLGGLALGGLGALVAFGLAPRSRRHPTRIETLPAAVLEIDGVPAGTSPLAVDLEPGVHRVLARRDGFDPATWTIDVPGPAALPPPIPLVPRPDDRLAGEVALVEAALGRPLLPMPAPPPAAPAAPGALHAVLPRGAVSLADVARLRIERTPGGAADASPPARCEVALRRNGAALAAFSVEVPGVPAEVELPAAALAALRVGDVVRWSVREVSAPRRPTEPSEDATSEAEFVVLAEDPLRAATRAALAFRVSAAPPTVRRNALAAYDLEGDRWTSAAASLLAAPSNERSPLSYRLVGLALRRSGAGASPSAVEADAGGTVAGAR